MNDTIEPSHKNKDFRLYLDMDGVLVNFEGGFLKLTKGTPVRDYAKQFGEPAARQQFLDRDVDFLSGLEWIHGGKEIWNAASNLFEHVYILSSAGTSDPTRGANVITGKKIWLKDNIPSLSDDKIFIVLGKHLKKTHAGRDAILVDDMPITIKEWNQSGGYGILHNSKNYKKTIEELEDLAGPIKLAEIVKRFKL